MFNSHETRFIDMWKWCGHYKELILFTPDGKTRFKLGPDALSTRAKVFAVLPNLPPKHRASLESMLKYIYGGIQ